MLALYEVYRKNGPGQGIRSDKEAEQYRQAVDKMADYALHYPTDETGSFPYRAGQDNGMCSWIPSGWPVRSCTGMVRCLTDRRRWRRP